MNSSQTNKHWLQKTIVVWLGAMLCCILWGSAFPCIKIGYRLFDIGSSDTATQILFAGYRFTFAGILTILIGSLTTGQLLYPRRQAIGRVLWLSLLQTVLQYLFFYVGLAHTSGVKASIIEAVNVFAAICVASLLFHQERLTFSKMLGCTIGFLGVILVNLSGMNVEFHLQGEGFILLSAIAYSFSSVFMKRYSAKDHPVMLSGYQFLSGGIIMIAVGLLMGGKLNTVTSSGILLLLYLAGVSAAAYSIWGLLLKYNPVSRVTVFGFMNPVCGVILSTILLHEKNQAGGPLTLISLALVCAGIYIVNRSSSCRPAFGSTKDRYIQ